MIIYFTERARTIISDYFNDYVGTQFNNDMVERAYHYSRIRIAMSHIHALDSYCVNGKNMVDIDDICTVEYNISEDDTIVTILNVYFYKNTEDRNWRVKFIIH